MQQMNAAARHALRQERAKPLLEKIEKQVRAAQSTALPASELGKGCRYILNLWPKLVLLLDYPEVSFPWWRAVAA